MIIVVAGHTGTRKKAGIERLALYSLQRQEILIGSDPDPRQLERTEARERIRIFSPEVSPGEQRPSGKEGFSVPAFLQLEDPEEQKRLWRRAMAPIVEEVSRLPEETDAFIMMHATFHYRGAPFCPWDVKVLRDLKPDVFVTLINDVTSVTRNLEAYYDLRPRDILAWRYTEIQFVDYTAACLGILPGSKKTATGCLQNYVFPVRHPTETLHDLLFTPDKPRVYACFPITATRSSPDAVGQINEFLQRLRGDSVVFEPTTIDDVVLRQAYIDYLKLCIDLLPAEHPLKTENQWLNASVSKSRLPEIHQPGATISFDPDKMRWVIDPSRSLYPGDARGGTIAYKASDIRDVWEDIYDQIYLRDRCLIEQSDGLVSWRPLYGRQVNRMTKREFHQAQHTETPNGRGIQIIYLSPPEDELTSESPDKLPGLAVKLPMEGERAESEALKRLCEEAKRQVTPVRPRPTR